MEVKKKKMGKYRKAKWIKWMRIFLCFKPQMQEALGVSGIQCVSKHIIVQLIKTEDSEKFLKIGIFTQKEPYIAIRETIKILININIWLSEKLTQVRK